MSQELETLLTRAEEPDAEQSLAASVSRPACRRRILTGVWTAFWLVTLSSGAGEAWPTPVISDSPRAATEETESHSEMAARAVPMKPLPLRAAPSRVAPERVVPMEPLPLPAAEPSVQVSQAAIEARIRDWATAWSEQRVDDYLSFYSSGFQPDNDMSFSQWARDRRRRLSAPSFIRVELDALRVRLLDDDKAWVELVQAYTSSSYHDVVIKLLELAREENGWKIISETVLATESGPKSVVAQAGSAS